MSRLFGTDGVRGLANRELTPELALDLSSAAARVLAAREPNKAPVALVGRDPRASSEMLEAAVCAGLASAGAHVWKLGVIPTPAVAFLVSDGGADLGMMLSASHNPMPDNGIKLFARGGHKLPDSTEDAIEAAMADPNWQRPVAGEVGRITQLADASERYVHHLLTCVPQPLHGLRVVLDAAHGAAAGLGPSLFRRAGADVITIGDSPDGLNINDGVGSTHLDPLREAVRKHAAHIGLALDGDADRCLAVSADGSIVDGDQILAILAVSLAESGQLRDHTIVATVMSNLGLHVAMRERGLKVLTTAVGDRYVLEALRERGLSLGGEQSGHMVMPEFSTTGDGLLTGLSILARMAATGQSLAELAAIVTRLPQVLRNVEVHDRSAVAASPAVMAAVAQAEAELDHTGRVLLRPSGTEQLVRVMVEAGSYEHAAQIAERLSCVVAQH
ncbi:MAG: phosphoglucosamine mutase [Acidimicrobiales bacterium]|nr:MAG: phosphoglucosamine mutase [Acidimicrobiales bacterium]